MAKLALIQRELKRDKLVAKYAKKYEELKAIIAAGGRRGGGGGRVKRRACKKAKRAFNAWKIAQKRTAR